jgi:flavin-dependent dehydrogenase
MADIAILGNGVAANLAAAHFRKTMPELGIAVIGDVGERRPVVGEALVEISTHFIREIGLGQLLVERHHPKYGLTYYYKTNLDDPSDRTYIVDESPHVPPFPSFLINRFTFDRDLRAHNLVNGIAFHPGRAVAVELGGKDRLHRVAIENEGRQRHEISCQWLIDATGRNRMLGRKLGLHRKTPLQKNVYWFRLVDFDPALLSRIRPVKKDNRSFDSYYCTHHFFGKGNWIWCIPIVSEQHSTMISIGITYRQDLYPGEIRTIDQFLDYVAGEHPVVVDLVKSGHLDDSNFYKSYMYETRQHYSPDRWFIIGDAGDTVDPLYSHGLALISVQARQVGEAIKRGNSGEPIDQFLAECDLAFTSMHRLATEEITHLYEVMHDPFRCHLRMHLAILLIFRLATPLIFNGYMWDPIGVKLFNRLVQRSVVAGDFEHWKRLIDAVGSVPHDRPLNSYLKVQSPFSLNYAFFERLDEDEIPGSISGMLFYLSRLRLHLLRNLGWRGATAFDQQLALLRDLARALAIRLLFHGKSLRKNRFLRRLVSGSSGEPKISSFAENRQTSGDLSTRIG